MRLFFRSIRTRVAIGSTLVAAIVLAVPALLLMAEIRAASVDAAATLAKNDLTSFISDLTRSPKERPDPPSGGQLLLITRSGDDTAVGSMSGALETAARQVTGTKPQQITVDGAPYVVVHRTVTTSSGTWSLWAARNAAAATAAADRVIATLMMLIPVVLAAIGIGAWFLVAASLRPVHQLRAEAEVLAAEGSAGRLEPLRRDDELGALADTLNDLLASVHERVLHERRMIADASHELRTPLAVLSAQLELAHLHGDDLDALRADLASIEAQTARLTATATAMLQLSALENAGEPTREHSTVGELVAEAMAAVDRGRTVASDGVDVDLELVEPLERSAIADLETSVFGRVLDNLVVNALHATPSGSVLLVLRTTRRTFTIAVQDTGSGVPEEFLARAFDRFARADGMRDTAGSGLGLPLVRAIVERAGGTATLENRAEGGAVARIALPVHPPAEDSNL